MNFKQHLINQVGIAGILDININEPFITITRFKSGGKWYDTEIKQLGKNIIDRINEDDHSIKDDFIGKYTLLNYFTVIEGYNLKGFCHYLF